MTSSDFIIDVQQLSKRFQQKTVVNNINLKVKKGEIFGFLGPNGSGKTTTIRMICGLLTPDTGIGHCLGYDIKQNAADIKKHVGYMTQRFSLYEDLSVYENLDFVARLYQIKNRNQRVNESLQALGLADRSHQLAGTLSGGWKQRLALSAALIHQPKLLLLDEPTAGVDPKARRDFWDHIHRLAKQGITTLVSTHYMDEAERCTRLAYIAYGDILTEGTAQDIIAASHLVTWQVTGQNLFALSQTLEKIPAIQQVAAFGNVLHVCGKNDPAFDDSIRPWQTNDYHWQRIAPNLEDIFISLVKKAHEGRA